MLQLSLVLNFRVIMEQRYLFYNETLSTLQGKGFDWINPPVSFKRKAKLRSGLVINMKGKTDFWRKTYYHPTLIKNDGHFFYKNFPNGCNIKMETEFHLKAAHEYDQAGLMVYLDEKHWVRVGLEYLDKKYRLSCIFTNNYSDWSSQHFESQKLRIRIYKLQQDIVVEAKEKKWDFVRIGHLNIDDPENTTVGMGVYACSPTEAGGAASFQYLSYEKVDQYKRCK